MPNLSSSSSLYPQERTEAECEILVAAAALFSERGFEGASLDAVARRMGCTKGRVYHYFRSKTALFCSVYQEAMDRLEERIESAAAAAPDTPALARLEAVAEAHVLALLEDREAHRVGRIGLDAASRAAARAEDREALEALRDRQDCYEARFRAEFEAARRAGGAVQTPDPTMLKTFFLALNGCLFFRVVGAEDGAAARRAAARRIARQCLYGVAATPEAAAR